MTRQGVTAADPAELGEGGVRLFPETRGDDASYKTIARELGCSPDRLRVWCRQAVSKPVAFACSPWWSG